MDDLEILKLEAVKKETHVKGRRLTGLEALEIEQKVEKEYLEKHGPPEDSKNKKLPLNMYRFD